MKFEVILCCVIRSVRANVTAGGQTAKIAVASLPVPIPVPVLSPPVRHIKNIKDLHRTEPPILTVVEYECKSSLGG